MWDSTFQRSLIKRKAQNYLFLKYQGIQKSDLGID